MLYAAGVELFMVVFNANSELSFVPSDDTVVGRID